MTEHCRCAAVQLKAYVHGRNNNHARSQVEWVLDNNSLEWEWANVEAGMEWEEIECENCEVATV